MKEMSPMLASPYEKSTLVYPSFASVKLDGIRCVIVNGNALTRSLKPIPNKYIREMLSSKKHSGLDGEIIIGDPSAHDVYNQTNSGVMSHEGTPDFKFYVFDDFSDPDKAYKLRLDSAKQRVEELDYPKITRLAQFPVFDSTEIDMLEQSFLDDGYEGIIIRAGNAPYKYGRATPKSGWLIKKKNFVDDEFEIIGFEELMHNDNEAFKNELGKTARSKAQENLRGGEILGAFVGRDLKSGATFKVGTGFDLKFREWAWANRKAIIGAIGIYKSFKVGVKDAPRHPVWKGFRDKRDMS